MGLLSSIGKVAKSVVGGIGGLLSDNFGAIVGGAADYYGGRQQQEQSQEMAREQMAFQERMSSTAHQREVADLRSAGLNPILSSHGGASSPSGAMGTAVNYVGDAARTAVSSAMAVKRLNADVEKIEADTASAKELPAQIRADTALKRTQGDLTTQQWYNGALQADQIKEATGEIADRRRNLQVENKILEENLHSAHRAAVADRERAKFFDSKFGQYVLQAGAIGRELNPFIEGANTAADLSRSRRFYPEHRVPRKSGQSFGFDLGGKK